MQDAEIHSLLPDSELDADLDKSIEYKDKVKIAIETLECNIERHQKPKHSDLGEAGPSSRVASEKRVGPKLPKTSLLNFDGDPLKWESFWDDFESSVDGRSDITTSDKFKLLRQVLKGDARRVVDGYTLTNANYEQVKDELREQYGDEQIVKFAHFERLLNLQPADHSLSELRRVHDDANTHIRSLMALGLTEDSFGQVFVPILLSKFPKYVKMELFRRNGSHKWTLSSLRTLLKDELRARDMSEKTESGGKGAKGGQSRGSGGSRGFAGSSFMVNGERSHKPPRSNGRQPCAFCAGDHPSWKCSKFSDFESRNKQTQHVVTLDPNVPPFVPLNHDTSGIAAAVLKNRGNALIKLGRGTILGPDGPLPAQFFFDDGSTLSFASSKFLRRSKSTPVSTNPAAVGRFGDSIRHQSQYLVHQLTVKLPNGALKPIIVNEIASISPPVNVIPIDLGRNSHIHGLHMAQPLVSRPTPVEIDILIGLDQYYGFIGPEQSRSSDGIVFHESVLGSIASGFLKDSKSSKSVANQHMQLLLLDSQPDPEESELGSILRKFLEVEETGIQTKKSLPEDVLAQKHFDETVKMVDGRYQVRWPYRFENPDLADTFDIAFYRLGGLLRRGIKHPGIIAEYQKTFADQISRGIIEVAPELPQGLVYYVPHHVVIKPDKATTKFRIVYDASAKPYKDSLSLNDSLLRGPVIMSDLVGCILRFRQSEIGLISDVEKAFHMVGLAPEDRDVTRFLWVRNLDKPLTRDNLICYRFARVPFGTVASSFLLAATIVHHLREHDSLNSRLMLENCYVDNILVGKSNLQQALAFYGEAKHLLSTASMNLREWFSNSKQFVGRIPEIDRGTSSCTSVIGISWDTRADTFACNLGKSASSVATTKRAVLAALASLFDPCGSFVPVSVCCRILMQELWKDGYSWDDPLPQSLVSQWESIHASLKSIPSLTTPRSLGLHLGYQELQVHIFADASSKAYGAVSYLRIKSSTSVSVSHLCAKARIAPMKPVTIPRLELTALTTASNLARFLRHELKLPVSAWFIWSDSKCVLYWVIRQATKPVFVANRVKEILDVPGLVFRYVPPESNPADIVSRGASVDTLRGSALWWHGPGWLQQPPSAWPPMDINATTETVDDASIDPPISVSPGTTMAVVTAADSPLLNLDDISSLGRALRITSFVFRFVSKLRGQSSESSITPSAAEVTRSLDFWIRSIQASAFSHFKAYDHGNAESHQQRTLKVFKDPDGILRSHGRVEHGDVPETARNPILLPSGNRFTFLVIKDVHENLFHAGPKHTLAKLREMYWVIHGRSDVRSVIRQCRLCRIHLGGPYLVPTPPDLPSFRVQAIQPFDKVGVDYLGPILVQEGDEKVKFWVCLFTCAATRAIHLESTPTLSATGFLQCLRRFVAIRRVPSLVVSDNAKQFRARGHGLLQ